MFLYKIFDGIYDNMEIECPVCHVKWDWQPPDDVVGITGDGSARPSRTYSITCPNKHELDIEV
jgi:hypothetical protein